MTTLTSSFRRVLGALALAALVYGLWLYACTLYFGGVAVPELRQDAPSYADAMRSGTCYAALATALVWVVSTAVHAGYMLYMGDSFRFGASIAAACLLILVLLSMGQPHATAELTTFGHLVLSVFYWTFLVQVGDLLLPDERDPVLIQPQGDAVRRES